MSEPQEEGMAEKLAVVEATAPSTDVVTEAPREKMIETAMKFLLNPQVRSSPLVQKKVFLRKKGLREKEIELAVERSGTGQDVSKPANQTAVAPPPQGHVPMATHPAAPPQQQMVSYMQPPPPSRDATWRDYMAIAVIVSGVSFGLYKLIMKWVTPWLKSRKEDKERMERIEASIQELNRNISETVSAVEKSVSAIQTLLEKQDSQVGALNAEILSSKALANSRRSTDTTEIKAEIASLKGLLLNRHQFPATPQRSQIPAWQRSSDSSAKSNSPPPAAESVGRSTLTPPVQEPITNGDSSLDDTHTPVKEPVSESGAESNGEREISQSPDEHANGSVEPISSQGSPAVNGAA